MSADDAIRFLEHEAQLCRDRDAHEALCLLLPAMLHVLNLPAMDSADAAAFYVELHTALMENPRELKPVAA